MRIESLIITIVIAFSMFACSGRATNSSSNNTAVIIGGGQPGPINTFSTGDVNKLADQPMAAAADKPKNIRDFFMLLPEKYFVLEGCERAKDKDCQKAKIDYLKAFTEVEDTANGYLKGGCDGGQSCLEMAIFKHPDGSYLVAVATSAEMMNDYYFLDYANGSWTDVSSSVVPQFSKKNMYELPRQGTTVKVFAKRVIEKGDDYNVSDKGEKLYDLEWKNSKFEIKK